MSGIQHSPERIAPRSLDPRVPLVRPKDDESSPSLKQIFQNPGLLKLDLMVHGVQLSPELSERAQVDEAYRNYFANTRDIELLLMDNARVTAPVGPSPYELVEADKGYRLRVYPERFANERAQEEAPEPLSIDFRPPSAFYTRKTQSGVPFSKFATIRGAYLALSPTSTCAFVGNGDQCGFCSLQEYASSTQPTVEDVLDAVGVALETDGIEVVYLSTGFADRPDGGVADLEPYIRGIKHRYNVLIAVDALPPKENSWIDKSYAMGVDAISYNLEIFDPIGFEKICPGPARHIGRKRFFEALEYAVGVFPAGAVICHLMVGMESLESTRAGIDALTERGITPVLPLFRPFRGVDMRLKEAETSKVRQRLELRPLAELYGHLYRRVRAQKIPMNWARHVSVATTPLEARFFTDEGARLQVLLDRIARTRVGRRTRAKMADLRRSLRVRSVPSKV